MGFESIIGQHSAKKLMEESLREGRICNAYMISGSRGMGKKTIARAFAAAIVCDQGTAGCGGCKSCTMAKAGSHPDIVWLRTAEDKKTIGVDEVRPIIGQAAILPYMASRKLFIIEDAQLLTEQAQNALLKVIEEPPSYVVFVFLVSDVAHLLETIRSRCLHIALAPYKKDELKEAIANLVADPSLMDFYISYSGANIGQAMLLIEDTEFASLREQTIQYILSLQKSGRYGICEFAGFFEENKESAGIILDCMSSVIRDVVFIRLGCASLMENTDKTEQILSMADKLPLGAAMKIVAEIIKTKESISRYVNYSLSVLTLLAGSWEEIHGGNCRDKVQAGR